MLISVSVLRFVTPVSRFWEHPFYISNMYLGRYIGKCVGLGLPTIPLWIWNIDYMNYFIDKENIVICIQTLNCSILRYTKTMFVFVCISLRVNKAETAHLL